MPLLLVLVPLALLSQTPHSGPVADGVLLERDDAPTGELVLRIKTNQVFRYRFDSATRVAREGHDVAVQRLEPGDQMEVRSDMLPGATLRYATEIQVSASAPARQAAAARRRVAQGAAVRAVTPANLLLSGTVAQLADGRLTLRTRDGAAQEIILRADTRYLANGELVGRTALRPNMRVSVTAARTVLGDVEAYQVVWGGILTPAR